MSGNRVSIHHVMQAAALGMGVRAEALTSTCRRTDWMRARQVAMYVARELTCASTPLIGQRLGNRDHTTVLHGVKRVAALMADDPPFAVRVRSVCTLAQRMADGDPTARKHIAPPLMPPAKTQVSKYRMRVRDCQVAAAQFFGVRIEALQGRLRDRDYSLPRLVAVCVAFDCTNLEPRDIGTYFGGLSARAIINTARLARRRRARDTQFRDQVETVARLAEAQARAWHESAAMPATEYLRTKTMEPAT